jgi:hypothetical protein
MAFRLVPVSWDVVLTSGEEAHCWLLFHNLDYQSQNLLFPYTDL